jgi:hypothetical protein
MAYGAFVSAKFHIGNSEFLRTVEPNTTVGEVVDVLCSFDYAYNVAAVAEIYDQGYHVDMSAFLRLLRKARDFGVYVTNSSLRTMIEPNAQLELSQLEIGSSFTIKINGIARVIGAIAASFDPTIRDERRERHRHTTVMNRLEEERAAFDLARDRFNAMHIITDDISNFNKRLREDLGRDQADELKRLIVEAYGHAIYSLRSNDIKTLEAPPSY